MQIALSRSYVSKQGSPVISNVDPSIFTTPAIPMPTDGSKCETCNYGVDITVKQTEELMPHTQAIKKFLGIPASKAPFYKNSTPDVNEPGVEYTRVTVHKGECTFAARDGQGPKCGVERYALTNDFDVTRLKPQVCTMYPVTYDTEAGALVVSDDEPATSGAQSVYQAARKNLETLFGESLVRELDEISKAHPFTPAAEPPARRVIPIAPVA